MENPGVMDYVVLLLMMATLGVLAAGMINMLTGKSPQRSNKLMVWRVVLQAGVILLAALFLARS